jgi:hypothetical protein
MISGFKKAIENFILPQFPWIMDYEVETPWINDDVIIRVVVSYYPELDEDGFFKVTPEFNEVEKQTKSVFDMMNDGEHILYNIRFTYH